MRPHTVRIPETISANSQPEAFSLSGVTLHVSRGSHALNATAATTNSNAEAVISPKVLGCRKRVPTGMRPTAIREATLGSVKTLSRPIFEWCSGIWTVG
jgi:hypothetical protein